MRSLDSCNTLSPGDEFTSGYFEGFATALNPGEMCDQALQGFSLALSTPERCRLALSKYTGNKKVRRHICLRSKTPR